MCTPAVCLWLLRPKKNQERTGTRAEIEIFVSLTRLAVTAVAENPIGVDNFAAAQPTTNATLILLILLVFDPILYISAPG